MLDKDEKAHNHSNVKLIIVGHLSPIFYHIMGCLVVTVDLSQALVISEILLSCSSKWNPVRNLISTEDRVNPVTSIYVHKHARTCVVKIDLTQKLLVVNVGNSPTQPKKQAHKLRPSSLWG